MSRQPKGKALAIRTSRDLKIFARRHAASCRIRSRLPLQREKDAGSRHSPCPSQQVRCSESECVQVGGTHDGGTATLMNWQG